MLESFERIEVGYKKIGLNYYHKYIVYVNSKGERFVARGGPKHDNEDGYGNLITSSEVYDENHDDYDEKRTNHYETIIEGDDLSDFWNSIKAAMEELNDSKLYKPLDYNSNSAVDLSLCAAGLNLPQDDGLWDYWAPASLDDGECSPLPMNMPLGIIDDGLLGPDMATPEKTTSPIILDLDGDGIETRSLQDGIFFDHDGNQFAENTGWVGADDGLLVLDRNNNGEIDTGQELFGSNTRLNDGSLAKNGYAALQELDSNQDGIINQYDEAWQQLQVWQDRNGNASVDEGELLSLEDAGIAAINTGYKNSNLVDQQGNAHKQTGTVIMQDGTINQSADVWFAANMGNTRYISDVDIPRNIRQLPYIRGFGNMADLHVAMSENAELRGLIERFIADPLSPDVDSLLQDIIFTWAGVNDIASDSRGDYIDARYLAVLEVATGDNYQNIKNGTVDPLRNAGALLNKEYAKFADYIQASLLAQTVYREDLSHIGLQINSESNGFTLNFEAFEVHLNTLMKTDIGRYLSVSHVFYDQLTYMPAFADERERLGIAGDKIFSGGDGDDVLRDNYLSGNRTNDYFWGAAGNDTLDGGYGSDTYLFNAGDGQDTIIESHSYSNDIDRLILGEGLLVENTRLARTGSDLWITFEGGTDSLRLKDYFYREGARYQVEEIVFADGTVWDVETVKAMLIVGTDDAQTLWAYESGTELHAGGGNDEVWGNKGADRLYGDEGNDGLSAGDGNDLLAGGYGSDTYQFNAGDGQDTIVESYSNSADIDRLVLGDGLLAENTRVTRTANDLWITFGDGTDSLRLKDYFYREGTRYQVEEIVFADGTVWDVETVKAMLIVGTDDAQTLWAYESGTEIHAGGGNDEVWGNKGADRLYGDEGNDGLSAGDGNDRLAGGTGNDWLTGGYGSDTYLFNAGDGQDTIVESYSNSADIDRLVLGDGLLAENTRLTRTANDLWITFGDGSDSLRLKDYFYREGTRYRVEEIVFADGTVWDVETVKAMLIAGTDDAQTLWAYESGTEIHAGGGNDEVWGNKGADRLYGDEGNDGLSAGDGNDRLAGGTGNDWLTGGYGSDTYLFNAGDGQDTIVESYSNSADIDRLVLGDGLLAENTRVTRTANDLWLTFGDGTDSLRLKDYFYKDSTRYRVDEIVFADGTVWDVETVKAMLIAGTDNAQTLWTYESGTEIHAGGGNDEVWGNKGADRLYGDEGNDGLSAGDGNDLLAGGTGNDWLTGGYGSDTYLFNAGDGQDTIVESYSSSSDSDTLRFGAAIQADSAIIQRSGNDLLIGFSGSDDRVTIKSYFSSSRFRVEHITFADGTDWQPEDILNHLEDGIQLPLAAPAEAPVSIQQMRELMATFSGGDEGSEDSVGDATPVLSTSRTTVRSLMCA
ncbi:calcium-binding protein [Kluyvera sichuanensis]|uniref:calcium-binding protein n=1 Tax=Kluyvera sichuanensis TaxID=2725494 RepID=UPI003F679AAE